MKRAKVENGTVGCPTCGSTSFDVERTTKGKTVGFMTVGVGVFLVPKRLKCLSCGTAYKRGNRGSVRSADKTHTAELSTASAAVGRVLGDDTTTFQQLEALYLERLTGQVLEGEYQRRRSEVLDHALEGTWEVVLAKAPFDTASTAEALAETHPALSPKQARALVDASAGGDVVLVRGVGWTHAADVAIALRATGARVHVLLQR
jgi:hypothetical protein